MKEKRNQFLRGAHAAIPIVLGFIPVGIAYAIMARQAGFTFLETVSMSLAVFAGASQMMATGMVADSASLFAMILATLILNLRHVIMSTCVFQRMRGANAPLRLLAAFGVTDESFAIYTTEKEENCTFWFFFGLAFVSYLSWVLGSAIGALASDLLPAILSASLGIALYAMFLALLVPGLRGNARLALLILCTAVCNSLLSLWIDGSWALILSTLLCAAIGVFFVDLGEEQAHES